MNNRWYGINMKRVPPTVDVKEVVSPSLVGLCFFTGRHPRCSCYPHSLLLQQWLFKNQSSWIRNRFQDPNLSDKIPLKFVKKLIRTSRIFPLIFYLFFLIRTTFPSKIAERKRDYVTALSIPQLGCNGSSSKKEQLGNNIYR